MSSEVEASLPLFLLRLVKINARLTALSKPRLGEADKIWQKITGSVDQHDGK
jgi:hypothetical protein